MQDITTTSAKLSFAAFIVFTTLTLRFTSDAYASPAINTAVNLGLILSFAYFCTHTGASISKRVARTYFGFSFILLAYFVKDVLLQNDILFSEFIRILYLATLLLLMNESSKRGFFKKTFNLFFIANLIIIAIGLYNIVSGNYATIEGTPRLNGTYAHPNPYGLHLVLVACFSLYAFLKTSENKWLILLILALAVFSQILNFSAILFGVAYTAWLLSRSRDNSPSAPRAFYALVIALAITMLVFAVSPILKARFSYIIDTGLFVQSTYAENSLQWRIMNWSYYFNNIENFLTGQGIGSTDTFYRQNHYEDFSVLAPHNEWLKVLFEYGILGVSALCYFITSIYKRISYESRGILLAFLIAAFFDNFFKSTSLLTLLFFSVLQIEAMKKTSHERIKNNSN